MASKPGSAATVPAVPQQIVIQSGAEREWTMIELQGTLSTKSPSLDGLTIGQLSIPPKGKVVLTIGSHLLDGSKELLAKPFAVLRKVQSGDSVSYEIAGVIRHKFIFKVRPRPISSSLVH
eukprot:gnl/Hemi2/21439_TR7137_c0_g1_i1.p2 gnl/Hemi2/21439_TR7137_c0_g1~~gnl/Hemi2/21439_TR7137_c0_g1_i1.p2  ORF type:complete len:120 (+),score=15.44 gnl/Hemi2/21439_TR7137_c0_g1_i1:63-422(+)